MPGEEGASGGNPIIPIILAGGSVDDRVDAENRRIFDYLGVGLSPAELEQRRRAAEPARRAYLDELAQYAALFHPQFSPPWVAPPSASPPAPPPSQPPLTQQPSPPDPAVFRLPRLVDWSVLALPKPKPAPKPRRPPRRRPKPPKRPPRRPQFPRRPNFPRPRFPDPNPKSLPGFRGLPTLIGKILIEKGTEWAGDQVDKAWQQARDAAERADRAEGKLAERKRAIAEAERNARQIPSVPEPAPLPGGPVSAPSLPDYGISAPADPGPLIVQVPVPPPLPGGPVPVPNPPTFPVPSSPPWVQPLLRLLPPVLVAPFIRPSSSPTANLQPRPGPGPSPNPRPNPRPKPPPGLTPSNPPLVESVPQPGDVDCSCRVRQPKRSKKQRKKRRESKCKKSTKSKLKAAAKKFQKKLKRELKRLKKRERADAKRQKIKARRELRRASAERRRNRREASRLRRRARRVLAKQKRTARRKKRP